MNREELIATIRLKTLRVFNPAIGRTPTAESKIQARRLAELQELKRMQEELEDEISAATDRIKAVMGEEEMLLVGAYKVTWKPVTYNRIDAKALERELPDVARCYTRTTTAHRFTVQ